MEIILFTFSIYIYLFLFHSHPLIWVFMNVYQNFLINAYSDGAIFYLISLRWEFSCIAVSQLWTWALTHLTLVVFQIILCALVKLLRSRKTSTVGDVSFSFVWFGNSDIIWVSERSINVSEKPSGKKEKGGLNCAFSGNSSYGHKHILDSWTTAAPNILVLVVWPLSMLVARSRCFTLIANYACVSHEFHMQPSNPTHCFSALLPSAAEQVILGGLQVRTRHSGWHDGILQYVQSTGWPGQSLNAVTHTHTRTKTYSCSSLILRLPSLVLVNSGSSQTWEFSGREAKDGSASDWRSRCSLFSEGGTDCLRYFSANKSFWHTSRAQFTFWRWQGIRFFRHCLE